MNGMIRFDHKVTQNGLHNMIWPIAETPTIVNTLYFPVGGRCGCADQIGFGIQCQHELKVSPALVVSHYNKRRLNRITFNPVYPHLQPICTLSKSKEYNYLQ